MVSIIKDYMQDIKSFQYSAIDTRELTVSEIWHCNYKVMFASAEKVKEKTFRQIVIDQSSCWYHWSLCVPRITRVKAAKSNRLSSRRVKICLRKIRSLRCRFTQNWVFLPTLFLENEAQIDRNNYGTMLFLSKQVSLPKISSILQKMKIGQKSDIRPFSTKAFNSFIYHKKYYIFFKLHAYKLAKIYPQSLSEHIVICDTCSLCFHQVRLEVWENLKKLWKHSPVSSCSHRISCSHKLPLVSECFFWGTIGW